MFDVGYGSLYILFQSNNGWTRRSCHMKRLVVVICKRTKKILNAHLNFLCNVTDCKGLILSAMLFANLTCLLLLSVFDFPFFCYHFVFTFMSGAEKKLIMLWCFWSTVMFDAMIRLIRYFKRRVEVHFILFHFRHPVCSDHFLERKTALKIFESP